jgi:hypothetical protein
LRAFALVASSPKTASRMSLSISCAMGSSGA